jgi:ankyrin repeat protein
MRTVLTLFVSMVAPLVHGGELHEAARVCDTDRMRQLLAKKPTLNEADANGMTPLHIAVDSRKVACVELLVDAGADRSARDRKGRSVLEAVDRIDEPLDRTKMFLLVTRGLGVAGSGSGKGMPQPATGPAPWSLEYAVLHRQANVTKMLLSMGADPNTTGTGGTTPLANAALKGDVESVRALLAHGARVSTVGPAGAQAIHEAALGDSAEVIRELVKQGAEVNARTRDEAVQTPLHIAAAMGKAKAVDALVALGADLCIKDASGRTAMQAAERAGLEEVAAVLRRAVAGTGK